MQRLKRVARIVGGFALLVAGVAMILLPGPGWATIVLGLAILAVDFLWARKALDHLKRTGKHGGDIGRAWWRRFRTRSSVADDGRAP